MFQQFLDVADYWFGYSDDSSIGSYDPAHEFFVVVADEHANGANGTWAGDGDAPQNPGPSASQMWARTLGGPNKGKRGGKAWFGEKN
jgi:hypothetical protein